MSIKYLFDNNLKNNGYNAEFFPSFQQNEILKFDRVIFHHIKKSGGMGVYIALSECLRHYFSAKKSIFTGRLDDENLWVSAIDDLQGKESNIFFASHTAGDHYFDFESVKRFTIFREPFDRVLSKYKYDCTRKGLELSETSFSNYIEKDENRFDYLQALAPKYSRADSNSIIEHLEKDFFAYFDISVIGRFLSAFCSIYGLPNIVMGRQNISTINKELSESIDYYKYKDEFLSVNKESVDLYDWVLKNQLIPEFSEAPGVNPYTLIVASDSEKGKYQAHAKIVKTVDLTRYISVVKSDKGMMHFFSKPIL